TATVDDPTNNTVHGPQTFDLQHTLAAARLVWQIQPLRYNTVKGSARKRQPLSCYLDVCRSRRQPDRAFIAIQVQLGEALKLPSSSPQRLAATPPVFVDKNVKDKQYCRVFRRVLARASATTGETRKKVVEGQHAIDRDHQLAVQHKPRRLQRSKGIRNLWKVGREQLGRLRMNFDLLSSSDLQAAEPIPFWLVLPALAIWNRGRGNSFHRGGGWSNEQRHNSSISRDK